MAIPAKKSPEITAFLDSLSRAFFGISRTEAIEKGICIFHKTPVTEFRDEQSRAEYTMSGLCQQCQDKMFID